MSESQAPMSKSAAFDMEQFKSLRHEIMRAMEDGNQIMSFGLAGVGLVFTAALSIKDTTLGFLLLAIMIPALSALVLSMWFSAHERIARASYFITGIERRLTLGVDPVAFPTWDRWLRQPTRENASKHHFWNTEYSGISIFVFLMIFPMLGSILVGGAELAFWLKLMIVAISLASLWPAGIWMRRRVKRWRLWLSSSFGELE